MRIRWDPKALDRLEAVGHYAARSRPNAADRTVERIFEAVDGLADFPFRGRPGRITDTRELVIRQTPYIVVYRVRGQVIEVLAVQHTAQRWPEHFNE